MQLQLQLQATKCLTNTKAAYKYEKNVYLSEKYFTGNSQLGTVIVES